MVDRQPRDIAVLDDWLARAGQAAAALEFRVQLVEDGAAYLPDLHVLMGRLDGTADEPLMIRDIRSANRSGGGVNTLLTWEPVSGSLCGRADRAPFSQPSLGHETLAHVFLVSGVRLGDQGTEPGPYLVVRAVTPLSRTVSLANLLAGQLRN